MEKIYNLEYNKTKECEILIFGDDFKFWSFFKMKHWIYKESACFFNSYLFNNDWKKNVMNWGTFKYF